MALELKLDQRLVQRLSPQQIQMIKLLELPAMQLEQRIKQEVEENPLLEEVETHESENKRDITVEEFTRREEETPYYKIAANNRSKDDKERPMVISAGGMSLQENLMEQLRYRTMSPLMEDITRYLVGNIDDDGYLRSEEQTLADDMTFIYGEEITARQIDEGIRIIQSLDPVGVGARDLRECLLLQLDSIPGRTPERDMARRIIVSYFEDFSKKRFDKLLATLRISEELLRGVIDEIRRLSPKPGNLYNGGSEDGAPYIIPDFVIDYQDGEFTLRLNQRGVPELKISSDYAEEVAKLSRHSVMSSKESNDAQQFVRSKMESAKWFINALRQRQETLMLTMRAILTYQKEYFIDGDETSLRPMILKDIADLTGLDVSTISRVVNSKYVQTNFGVILLKQLFSEAMQTSAGEEVSAHEVRKILRESIEGEDKRFPLTDEELMERLNTAGYTIARRTVAKYREGMGIPVARLRKEL